jgi:FkbM family methyltransferase
MSKVESYGFRPSFGRKIIRSICVGLIKVLSLNGRSIFSNEFIQSLDPKIDVEFEKQKLTFRTGNGRLLWRANSLLTEEPLMISWIKSMKSDDVVLDVGANVGMYTVPIAKKAQAVYACELDPLNVAILKENLFLNAVTDNVVVLPFACGESARIVEVTFRDLAYGDALQLIEGGDPQNTRFGHRTHTANVIQFSLDEVFVQLNLPRPNKIKIDVDGNELTVLHGMKDLIRGANEVYFEDSFSDSCKAVVQYLSSVGFNKYQSVEMVSKNNSNQIIGENIVFKK